MLLLGKAWKIAAAVAAILTASRRVIQKTPIMQCSGGGRGDSAARCALERSAKLLNKASSGKKVPVEHYCAAMEALMPAFSAYGKMFENAARKDVQGNVDKLRSRAKALQRKEAGAMVLRERELDPAKTEAPDSAARALFWINKIVSQIAMSFEFLLDRPNASLTRCATDAYVKTCGPYSAWEMSFKVTRPPRRRRRDAASPRRHRCGRMRVHASRDGAAAVPDGVAPRRPLQ